MTGHAPDPFRSDHASSWLVLKGRLSADKPCLLEQLDQAITAPDRARGLQRCA